MDGRSTGAVSARLALGITTVALVTLASAGTAVVVRTGASAVTVGSLPPQVDLPLDVGGSEPIIVGGPPGRVWPDEIQPIRRSARVHPFLVGLSPAVASRFAPVSPGAVQTSFSDRAQPRPIGPLIPTAPAASQPAGAAPTQTSPVDNQPVPVSAAGPAPVQRPTTAPRTPATDPARGGTSAVAVALPGRPGSPEVVGTTVPAALTAAAALARHGRPSTRGDQPTPPAEQPIGQWTGQPATHPLVEITVRHRAEQPAVVLPARVEGPAYPGNRPPAGGHPDGGDDRQAGWAGRQQPNNNVDQRPDDNADRHGSGGADVRGPDSAGDEHGHGNRPS